MNLCTVSEALALLHRTGWGLWRSYALRVGERLANLRLCWASRLGLNADANDLTAPAGGHRP
jgi:hypothetical protein